MPPDQFWGLHPDEFWWLMEAHQEKIRQAKRYGSMSENDVAELYKELKEKGILNGH